MTDKETNAAAKMSLDIYHLIINSDEDMIRRSPDAIIRVFVYIAKKNEWSLEKIKKEVDHALEYYYTKDITKYDH